MMMYICTIFAATSITTLKLSFINSYWTKTLESAIKDIKYSNKISFSNWQISTTNVLWRGTKIHSLPCVHIRCVRFDLQMLVKPLFFFYFQTTLHVHTLFLIHSSNRIFKLLLWRSPKSELLDIIFQMCVKFYNIICK